MVLALTGRVLSKMSLLGGLASDANINAVLRCILTKCRLVCGIRIDCILNGNLQQPLVRFVCPFPNPKNIGLRLGLIYLTCMGQTFPLKKFKESFSV